MAFKSPDSFLQYLSMGAAGTERVRAVLTDLGHRIIELERGTTSNKIWTIKVKRLRVPDLLCVNCGLRVESRAKSYLKLSMSHTPGTPERHWDNGLRDDDLVAFVACRPDPDADLKWRASSHVNLFRVGDLRRTFDLAKQDDAKSRQEGSEIEVEWPAYVPGVSGRVVDVVDGEIVLHLDSGRKRTYSIKGKPTKWYIHVRPGTRIEAGEVIAASVVPDVGSCHCPDARYDFVSDLLSDSTNRASVYAAIKALGHLDYRTEAVVQRLIQIMDAHPDRLVSLEAAGTLARLGNERGWQRLANTACNHEAPDDVRMEAVLILRELGGRQAEDILSEVAQDTENPAELRAAAVWCLGDISQDPVRAVCRWTYDGETVVAVHAITVCVRALSERNLATVFSLLGPDSRRSAAATRIILDAENDLIPHVLIHLRDSSDPSVRDWLTYLLGLAGRPRVAPYVHQVADLPASDKSRVEFMWSCYQEDWTRADDVQLQLKFLRSQR